MILICMMILSSPVTFRASEFVSVLPRPELHLVSVVAAVGLRRENGSLISCPLRSMRNSGTWSMGTLGLKIQKQDIVLCCEMFLLLRLYKIASPSGQLLKVARHCFIELIIPLQTPLCTGTVHSFQRGFQQHLDIYIRPLSHHG